MTQFRRDYKKIREKIKQSGNVCIYDMTIAGEGVGGIFAAGFILSYIRLHIINNTFHPYLLRYLCGSSIGAIVIQFILKIWYLYETNEDKELSLEFIDICYQCFDFITVRQIMVTIDENNTLSLNNAYKLITNMLINGGALTRDGIIKLLRCDTPRMLKFKPYFATNEFDEWLRIHLNNVFITVQSSETSVGQIFTGKPRLFKTPSKLIKFRELTPGLFEHVILCSSGILGVYEPLKIDGNEYSCDGSTFVGNPMNVPQILHNLSYYNNIDEFFMPVLDYFEITSQEFIIHTDVMNIQTYFETVPTFPSSSSKFVQTLIELWMQTPRQKDAACHNYELSSVTYTQPIIMDFSTVDANEVKGDVFTYNQSILLQPENQATVLNLKTSDIIVHETLTRDEFETNRCYQINDTYENYCDCHKKYAAVVSKNPLSSYIYDSREFSYKNVKCNIIDTNTFIRNLYSFDNTTETIKIVLNYTRDIENWTLCKNAGHIQANVMYNIYLKRMNMKWNEGTDYNLSLILQKSYDNFLK
jgi:hypothetical protein